MPTLTITVGTDLEGMSLDALKEHITSAIASKDSSAIIDVETSD